MIYVIEWSAMGNKRIDDILATIDAGLQSSAEHGYGRDKEATCWRCQLPWLDPLTMCKSCQMELEGHPMHGPQQPGPFSIISDEIWLDSIWSYANANVLRSIQTYMDYCERLEEPQQPTVTIDDVPLQVGDVLIFEASAVANTNGWSVRFEEMHERLFQQILEENNG